VWQFRVHLSLIQIGVLVIVVVAWLVAKQAEITSFPPPVVASVEARFPGASWREVKSEDEGGSEVQR
jgi:hypothetical protein